ncbi:hypothetical protein GALL_483810 [mine drainage metagenome]|uniref:Uncharacterized protein n=1 Tax=mine drainage metagenome TaxID=410659 RepID=A0A1J5PR11_9ZZZZ
MERFKQLIELARIERVRDILLAPIDQGKPPLSVTDSFMAGLHQRLAEIEASLG